MTVMDDGEEFLIVPTTLATNLTPIDVEHYEFKGVKTDYSMQSKIINQNLFTFGIYGRHYSLDKLE